MRCPPAEASVSIEGILPFDATSKVAPCMKQDAFVDRAHKAMQHGELKWVSKGSFFFVLLTRTVYFTNKLGLLAFMAE